ncbi:hypothetical protein DdX_14288 [Ditylenchus destructor]|uniref:Secreted protein n=1 Tax=Ditylenchus destructor TaxID=166010 RepID=A0AAD4MUJ9_9BILA|nr:hypothetical protein DdX_14288 [Ditylenchus destructor]
MKPYVLLSFFIFVPIFAKFGHKAWSKKWAKSTAISTATPINSTITTTAASEPMPDIIIKPSSLSHPCILNQNSTLYSCTEKYKESQESLTSAGVCRTNVNINDPACRNLTDYIRYARDDFIRHGLETSNNAVVLPPSGDPCVLKHQSLIENCFPNQLRDINTNPKEAANVCSKLLIGMECMRKVLADNCGADQAERTIQATTLKQNGLDMSVPECQRLDVYIKLGASEEKGSADFVKNQYLGSLATLVILFTSVVMNAY